MSSIPTYGRVAVFGGVYSNHLALKAAIDDARSRDVDAILCLGDLGAFGPTPDKVFPLLREHGIRVVRGNYDDSIARGLDDCQCGYTDPKDNHYARLSYRYTYRGTSPRNRAWMAGLPEEVRFRMAGREVLAFHGSPRRTNEFLWESTTPTHFLDKLARDHDADILLGTHTGIPWTRAWDGREPAAKGAAGRIVRSAGADAGAGAGADAGAGARGDSTREVGPSVPREATASSVAGPTDRMYANVGALGRPANDGRTEVWYALLEATEREARHAGAPPGEGGSTDGAGTVHVELVPVAYDHQALAAEMRSEELPEEFVETILTGWWTTCLEILPGKERAAGRF